MVDSDRTNPATNISFNLISLPSGLTEGRLRIFPAAWFFADYRQSQA
jgi:hypothetical protein